MNLHSAGIPPGREGRALQKLITYVHESLLKPLEERYNATCDIYLTDSEEKEVIEIFDTEAEEKLSLEWKHKVQPYLQEILLHTKEAEGRRIGFYGERGAGKSSLINAILGVNLLPTHVSTTCTAAVSEITAWDKRFYHARIFFISQQEWQMEVEMARDLLAGRDPEDDDKEEHLGMFLEKIQALCGSSDKLELEPEQLKLLQTQSLCLEANNAEDLAKKLRPYIYAEKKLWPLVERVYIRGPFDYLRGMGVSLLDIPGVKDGFGSMKHRAEEALDACDSVFYMPLLAKCCTKDTIASLQQLALVPRVGIVVSRLRELLESHPSWTPATAGESLKKKILKISSNIPADVPVYCVETKRPEPEEAENLKSFIRTELKEQHAKDVKSHAIQLQNDLNSILTLFRKAMLPPTVNLTQAKASLIDASNRWGQFLKHMISNSHIPSEMSGILSYQPTKHYIEQFRKLKYNTMKMHLREGLVLGPEQIDQRNLRRLSWTDIHPSNITPPWEIDEFLKLVEVDPSALDSWKHNLDLEREELLKELKVHIALPCSQFPFTSCKLSLCFSFAAETQGSYSKTASKGD